MAKFNHILNALKYVKIVPMEWGGVFFCDTPSILAVNLWFTAEKSFL